MLEGKRNRYALAGMSSISEGGINVRKTVQTENRQSEQK